MSAVLVTLTSRASAQGSGQLSGVALSQEEIGLAGATIEVKVGGQVVRRVMTDSAGSFRIADLAPGTYTVAARLVGYREAEAAGVRIVSGQSARVTFRLEAAPVELAGLAAVGTPIRISRVDTDFGRTVEAEAIRALPVGHDAKDLVNLTPGARAAHVWGGATAQANNYQLDGVAANHPGIGGDLIEPSLNWIETIEIRGLGAGAEHGNFQGGLINVITKSGSNDLRGAVRLTGESHRFNASALGVTEIGSEVSTRYDVEGEVRGPILRDRLFFFVAGQRIERDARYINHLTRDEVRYLPTLEQRSETKFFGKLTYQPFRTHRLEASVARVDNRTEHYGLTGYEAAEGTLRLRAPTSSYSVSWRSQFGPSHVLEARFGHFTRDERRDPYAGPDIAGVLTWGLNPPYLGYQNAPLRYRHAPESTGGSASWIATPRIAGLQQQLRLGVEHNTGAFVDQRLRNGGMTWRPSRLRTFDAAMPSTWFVSAAPFVATTWGGEVDLHAEVESSAAYAQTSLALHARLSLTPGVRWGRWRGWLLPGGRAEDRFATVATSAIEPRIGLIYDLTGDSTAVFKAHWGRYHQNLVAQMFERAEGGEVFTDEEVWYYRGPVFEDPTTTLTREERDALAAQGRFRRELVTVLSETGPIENLRQPHVDQWLVGLEKTFGGIVKAQALYVNRRNRNMIALVDRNRATNYTRYTHVRVLDGATPLPYEGGTVQLQELFLPNWILKDRLLCLADGSCAGYASPPGLSIADTASLTWDPAYALTNAPDAHRRFDQFQVIVEVVKPRWSLSLSGVLTRLEGNLDNVTGYDDPASFSAGPWVRVNEGVNSYGKLPNYAGQEMKVSFFAELPWQLRGGVFWTRASGDHFAPYFTISGSGFYQYTTSRGQIIDSSFLYPLNGHRVFIGPRGLQQHHRRAQFDIRLERELPVRGRQAIVTLDIFNIINSAVVTDVNRSVNRGQNYFRPEGAPPPTSGFVVIDPSEFYLATRERVPPRTVRLGLAVEF